MNENTKRFCIFCGRNYPDQYSKSGKRTIWFHSECYEADRKGIKLNKNEVIKNGI